jgi:hypothetical protein
MNIDAVACSRLLRTGSRVEAAEIKLKINGEARPLKARAHAKFGTVNGSNSSPLYVYLFYTYVNLLAQWCKTSEVMRWHGTTIYERRICIAHISGAD